MEDRRLAAIMFTDIVGYTALMGKDTNKALDLLKTSNGIQKPLVEKYRGKWLKEIGDGILTQFNSALDAVNCAIEIQKTAQAKLEAQLRIGIHLGDITFGNNDVFGDGVNIASRLESIADPGGIYISESIEKAIRGQSNVQAKYLGEIKLKNVDYDVRTYALQGVGLPLPNLKQDKNLSGRFIAELQRRGVLRTGITYLILSLLLILLVPYLKSLIVIWPWFTTALYTLLGMGFPVAMYLAWNYERSPKGFVRTTSKDSWRNPYKSSRRKPLTSNYIIVGLILVIAVMYFYPQLKITPGNNKLTENHNSTVEKSIAVLPFVNMRNDPDQDYFSIGIMNEIIMQLVKIGDLSVTSRTSVMQYKETVKTVPEIARVLGVAHVLEGSFWKEGNKMRITVQLVDTRNDKNVWAESYEQDISDLWAIQSEVAQKVATALESKISSETRRLIESRPTDSEQAYQIYLEATYQYYTWTFEGREKAENLFEEALEIDPEFAEAYAYLGNIRSAFHWAMKNPRVSSAEEAVKVALPYYNKALEIDPDNVTAHKFLAEMYLYFEWDFKKAQEEYETVLELEPNYCWNALLYATGRFEEADEKTKMQVQLDPINLDVWIDRIYSLIYNNEREKVLGYTEMLIQKDIGSYYVAVSEFYLYLEKYEEAIQMVQNWFNEYPDTRPPRTLSILAIAYYFTGQEEKISSIISELEDRSKISSVGSPSLNLAKFYAQTGKKELAFNWLEKAYQSHENDMVWIKSSNIFEPLHNDPRWQAMLYKVGFPD